MWILLPFFVVLGPPVALAELFTVLLPTKLFDRIFDSIF